MIFLFCFSSYVAKHGVRRPSFCVGMGREERFSVGCDDRND